MRRAMQIASAVIFMIKVSVTFGEGGTCDECITIKPTSGEPSELVGSYLKLSDQGKYNCPTSCAYEKENDTGNDVWCFKPGVYKYDDKCSSSTTGETPVSMTGSTSSPHTMETPVSMGSTSTKRPHHTTTRGPHGPVHTTMHGRRKWHVEHMLNNKYIK